MGKNPGALQGVAVTSNTRTLQLPSVCGEMTMEEQIEVATEILEMPDSGRSSGKGAKIANSKENKIPPETSVARLPVIKTLNTYDFTAMPSVPTHGSTSLWHRP